MTLARRSFITGLISLVAAPAIIRAGSLMPVKVMVEPIWTKAVIFQDDMFWVRNDGAFMVYRNSMIREYISENLFQPYSG